jgi:hypothetical protein
MKFKYKIKKKEKVYKYILFLILNTIFFNFKNIKSIIPINGDLYQSFSFPILSSLLVDSLNKKIYIAASDTPPNEKSYPFGISVCNESSNNFKPILTKKAYYRDSLDENPLYGTGFNFIGQMNIINTFNARKAPIVVSKKNPDTLFLLNSLSPYLNEPIGLVSTDSLTDTLNNPGKILNFGPMLNAVSIMVCEESKNFNDINSNSVLYGYKISETARQNAGGIKINTKLEQSFKIPYDQNLDALKINNSNVSILSSNFSMLGDTLLNTTYIGITGTGLNGIRALTNLTQEIVTENACIGDKIIATNTPGQQVTINNLAKQQTSTDLTYLIIHGGNGNEEETKNTVYAIPLVNDNLSISYQKLANINEKPNMRFSNKYPYIYIGNYFSEEALLPIDLYDGTNINAKVGRGPLQSDATHKFKINSIESYSDCIFVNAEYDELTNDGIGGLFYSQALFDEYGRIATWTPWQRKNLVGNYSDISYVPYSASNVFIFKNFKNTVFKNEWTSNGSWNLAINNIYESLPISKNGIQGIIDIPIFHPGLNPNIATKPSYIMYLGYNTVIIQQTSKNNNLIPINNIDKELSKNGSLSSIDLSKTNLGNIIFTGGELNNAGALITGALGFKNDDCWFFAGGSNGLFVLCKDDGSGCGAALLGDNFSGLTNDMSWKKICDFSNIIKIISNDGFLYVISKNNVSRLELNKENILMNKSFPYTEIATLKDIPNPNNANYISFSDGIISSNMGILATSNGLLVTGKNGSVLNAKNSKNCNWELFKLPECDIPPMKLFAISKSGFNDDWSNGNYDEITGNIYLLCNNVALRQSKIYRFSSYGSNNGVTENSLNLLKNYFIKDVESYYFNPEFEILSIIGDGASWYTHTMTSLGLFFKGFISILNPFLKSGQVNQKDKLIMIYSPTPLSMYIGPVSYNSGTGLWLSCSQNGVYGLC